VIEDLNVSGMLANHKLAKSIASLSFFQWRCQLTYKCELYGSKLVALTDGFCLASQAQIVEQKKKHSLCQNECLIAVTAVLRSPAI
jgi:putative transposase